MHNIYNKIFKDTFVFMDVNPEEIIDMLFLLINEVSVMVTVIAVVVSSFDHVKQVVIEKKFTYKNQIIMILLFGAFSIFGNYSGEKLSSGAIANIRDIGPLVAGLIGGPIIGLGAGLIGGINRYYGGGFTALPCSIATISAGLIGGLVYKYNNKEFVGAYNATIIAALIELYHMGITLVLARPFNQALEVVKIVVIPMTLSNALGVAIFSLIIGSLIKDKKKIKELEENMDIITAKEEDKI